MILTIDIRNSYIVLGSFKDGQLVHTCRISAKQQQTSDQYAILLKDVFALDGMSFSQMEGAIISSVVPSLTPVLKRAIEFLAGCQVLVVDNSIKSRLNLIEPDSSAMLSDIAPDIVCSALYAVHHYPQPTIIIDNGTAIKFTAVNQEKKIAGCAICPGMEMGLHSLTKHTAQLSGIALHRPSKAIECSTGEALNSGMILGTASMLDGMIDHFDRELDGGSTIVFTGVYDDLLIPCCSHQIQVHKTMVLEGLRLVYQLNTKKG